MLSRRPLICTLVTVSVASAFALDELTESPPPSLSEVRGCALAGALQDAVNLSRASIVSSCARHQHDQSSPVESDILPFIS